MKYFIYYFSGARRLAYPVEINNPFLASAATSCYPGTTNKKKFFKVVIKFLQKLSLSFFCSSEEFLEEELAITVAKLRLLLCNILGKDYLFPVVIWPNKLGRARVYVYFLDGKGRLMGVSKLAYDEINTKCLQNEKTMHQHFVNNCDQGVNGSQLLYAGIINNFYCLSYASMPSGATLLKHKNNECVEDIIQKYSGDKQMMTLSEALKEPWVENKLFYPTSLCGFVDKIFDKLYSIEIPVCFVHGDFGGENIYELRGEYWIIDWEQAATKAPCQTDYVANWLGSNVFLIKHYPAIAAKRFVKKFQCNTDARKNLDIYMALVFLCSAKFDLALIIVCEIDLDVRLADSLCTEIML